MKHPCPRLALGNGNELPMAFGACH
jgi:hypothetical protein